MQCMTGHQLLVVDLEFCLALINVMYESIFSFRVSLVCFFIFYYIFEKKKSMLVNCVDPDQTSPPLCLPRSPKKGRHAKRG